MWSRAGFSGFDPDDSHPLDREAESVMASAASRAGGRVSLQYLLGALLAVEVPLRWRTSLAARGSDDTTVRDSYNSWLEAERKGGTEVERKGDTEANPATGRVPPGTCITRDP